MAKVKVKGSKEVPKPVVPNPPTKKQERDKKETKQESKLKGKKEIGEKKDTKKGGKPKDKIEETKEKDDSDTLTDPRGEGMLKGLDLLGKLLENEQGNDDGDETVSNRMAMGYYASDAIYDPIIEVEASKFEKLQEYIAKDGDERVHEFYKVIITPRKSWPQPSYGWLSSEHIELGLALFRKRAALDPTPFCSSRIAFLGPYTTSSIVLDFKNFKVTSFDWKDSYVKLFNGEYPKHDGVNKKWIEDVDRLFVCHNVSGNHWVALDIRLVECQIDVYDSIPSLSSDKVISQACMPFSKMFPALINHMRPTKSKKKYTQFKVKRIGGIPHNENPGDCGVYALKYIECLALGIRFDGLCDASIQRLRERLGAELFDEFPEEVDYGLPLDEDVDDDDLEDITGT